MNLEELSTVAKEKYNRTGYSKDKKSMLSIEKYVLRWGGHLYIHPSKEMRELTAQALSVRTGDSVAHCKERLEFFNRVITGEKE